MRQFRLTGRLAAVGVLLGTLVMCVEPTEPGRRSDRPPAGPAPSPVPRGDVAAGAPVLVGAGDIAQCSAQFDEQTATLMDGVDGTVFALGDDSYTGGTAADFANCYDPSWGRHKARTRPAAGEKEYSVAGATPYYDYFGAAAGDRDKGYYSYNVGSAWHIVVLNSNIDMKAGSAQEQWLRADLASHPTACTLAYWHYALYYSGSTTVRSSVKPLWDALYAAGADVVLNSHTRNYERFAPQSPSGAADSAGIREIIVGTGGSGHGSFGTTPAPNSVVRDRTAYGVLKVTLGDGTYTWQFIPVPGSAFTDAGSGTCHNAGRQPLPPNQLPGADAAGPYTGAEGGAIAFDGSASSDPDGNTPLTYAWTFGDSTKGTGVKPTHAYADDGSYTVSLTVTDMRGGTSTAVTTTATVANASPTVNAGVDRSVSVGAAMNLSATYRDPGAADGPWAFSIDWGDGSPAETGTSTSAGTPIAGSHAYAAAGTYTLRVSVTDKDSAQGTDAATVVAADAPPPGSSAVFVGAGDIGICGTTRSALNDEKTAAVLDTIPGTVFAAGDLAYENGTDVDFANCYGTSWGRFKSRTRPAPGNHEYNTPDGTGYFNYWGAAAGEAGKGHYSFDLGTWHIVVLNDNIPFTAGSPQEQWLRADLAAHPARCTLAMWHRPMFYSTGSGPTTSWRPSMKAMWQPLYDAGAEIVLNAHTHLYERYAPQDPAQNPDPARGIREFIVGTGGASIGPPDFQQRNSEYANGDAFGVLKFTLGADSYSWQFIQVAGSPNPNTDSGTAPCH